MIYLPKTCRISLQMFIVEVIYFAFSYQNIEYQLPKIENSFAVQLKDKLTKIQYKLAEDNFGWTVKV